MRPAYIAASPDEIAIPDPGGRTVRFTYAFNDPVSLLRTTVLGVECFVERWPGSLVMHPAAERHAHEWLSRQGHREAVAL